MQVVDVDLANRLNQLIESALAKATNKSLTKYGGSSQKGKSGLIDVGQNYFGLPRGFDASEEGARVVLNEPGNAHSLESEILLQQKSLDEIHPVLVACILEIALGLGCSPTTESQRHVKKGMQNLTTIAGPEAAGQTLEMLVEWAKTVDVKESVFQQRRWDAEQLENKITLTEELAFNNDPLASDLQMRLHRYSDHSKSMRTTAKVVEGTFTGISMFGPGFGIPIAAKTANAGFGVANGGSEESKLLRQVYYQKQLELRRSALAKEAQSILLHYKEALETQNSPLLLCCEALIAQMVGAIGIQQIIEQPALAHGTFLGHPIEASCNSRRLY